MACALLTMILAFDTYYFNNKAKTVCLQFNDWADKDDYQIYSETLACIEEYIPGEFYKRELPCILSLFAKIDTENLEAIIVDGYVFLDDDGKPGLGAHLYNAIDGKCPVIGVAKSNFATLDRQKRQVCRGNSKNPLFLTSIGIDTDIAALHIKNMNGQFRIPYLLKELDKLTKQV
ncbi:MAG: endonuclease V [Bacteroidota bacterium]